MRASKGQERWTRRCPGKGLVGGALLLLIDDPLKFVATPRASLGRGLAGTRQRPDHIEERILSRCGQLRFRICAEVLLRVSNRSRDSLLVVRRTQRVQLAR